MIVEFRTRKKTPIPEEIFLVVYGDDRTRTYLKMSTAKGEATRWNNYQKAQIKRMRCDPESFVPARILRSPLQWEETDYQFNPTDKERKEAQNRQRWLSREQEALQRQLIAVQNRLTELKSVDT